MTLLSVPGLPDRQTFDKLPDSQKLLALYDAIEQVWGSLVQTGQQLTARVAVLEQHRTDDLASISQRLKAVEDRLASEGED